MVTRNVTFKAFAMLIFLGCALSLTSAQAAQKTTKKSSKRGSKVQKVEQGQVTMKPGVIKQNLSTDMRFDDLSVKGKRQTPLGLQVVVEAEKDVPSLVDFRKNYKDRAENSLSGR